MTSPASTTSPVDKTLEALKQQLKAELADAELAREGKIMLAQKYGLTPAQLTEFEQSEVQQEERRNGKTNKDNLS